MPLTETVAGLCRVIETLEGIVRRQAAELEQLGALAPRGRDRRRAAAV